MQEDTANLCLDTIDGNQAMIILKELIKAQPSITTNIQKIINQLHDNLDVDDIGEDVFAAIDLIDVEDLWRNSGSIRDGYIEPGELAFDMVEEAIDPYVEKFKNFLSNSMLKEAKIVCMGIIKGLNDFETKSTSEFQDWAPDVASTLQDNLLDDWKKHCKDEKLVQEIENFRDNLE